MTAPARTRISKKNLLLPLIVVLLLSAAASGCRQENANRSAAQSQRRLSIGLVPEESMFRQFARYEPLARYLSKSTGFEIELTVLPRYESILTSFTSQNMDAAFFGSLTYVRAHRKLGVQAIARPERPDGREEAFMPQLPPRSLRRRRSLRKGTGEKRVLDLA